MEREVWLNRKNRVLIPEVVEALRALFERGRTDAQIAEHFGISYATARKIREAAGLPRQIRGKMKVVQIRLPVALEAEMREAAERSGSNLSEVIRTRCEARQ